MPGPKTWFQKSHAIFMRRNCLVSSTFQNVLCGISSFVADKGIHETRSGAQFSWPQTLITCSAVQSLCK